MSRRRWRFLGCLLVACCHAGGGARPADPVDPTRPQAFTVKATLTVEPKWVADNPGEPAMREDTFSLYLDPRGPKPVVVVSRRGTAASAPVVPAPAAAGDRWTSAGELILRPGPGQQFACLGWTEVHYRQLEIVRDGAGIRGTIKGGAAVLTGDVVRGVGLEGTFVGTPDVAPPVASLEEPRPHPGDPLTVQLTEATPAGTSVFLVAGDGSRRALVPDPAGDGPRAAFRLVQPLGPSAGQRIVFEPGLVDLGGHAAAQASLALEPTAIPLLPEDGFEGPTPPFLFGGAVITGAPGAREIYIPAAAAIEPGVASRASLRLRVEPGDRMVRATLKGAFVGAAGAVVLLPIAVISPTGAVSKLMTIPIKEPFTQQGPLYVSAPTPIELPLPEGVGSEVLIDVARLWSTCGGLSPGVSGAYLDDLRVE